MTEIEATGDNPDRGQSRDGRGRFYRDLDTATKDTLAARMRTMGAPYKVIAAKLGYADESGAHKAVQRALAAVPVDDVRELRALESERLDMLTEKLWDVLGKLADDPAGFLAAVDRLTRISEQRARLLGLNAPAPRPTPEPAPLELTAQQVALLQRLLQALPIETAEASGPFALPMTAEKPEEAL